MTLSELIEKLEDIRSQNAGGVIVAREDNSGGCESIKEVKIEEAIDITNKQKTIVVVIG